MKTPWFAALCAIALLVTLTACGTTRRSGDRKGRWVAQETGSLLPRWVEDSRGGRDARATQRKAKAKRDRASRKAKAYKDARKRETEKPRRKQRDDDVITRGGFR